MFDVHVDPEPWMEDSKCARDKELLRWQIENREDQFFDDTYETRGREDLAKMKRERAKSYCSDCPVREECLAFALREEIPHGIFGGVTARQRVSMKKKARKSALEFLARMQVQLPDDSDPIAS